MTSASTDRIEKTVLLHAPRSHVWRAIADAREFGAWFGAKFSGPFAPGARITWELTYHGHDLTYELIVEKVEPERLLSYRWHPHAVEPGIDYSDEPMTLVVFELSDVAGGTLVKVTESGFDTIPLARRALAFRMNSNGWAEEVGHLETYVHGAA